MPKRRTEDPYAPPPMHHDRSGAVLRVAIIAALIGAAAWGYMTFGQREQTALAPESVQEQQVADAGYPTATEALPPAEAEAQQAPTPAAPAPPPRRTAPAEPTPPPSTSSTPTTPTPIPPG